MSGSVVYTLHLWPPLGHAAHYTGSPESSRILKGLVGASASEFAASRWLAAGRRLGCGLYSVAMPPWAMFAPSASMVASSAILIGWQELEHGVAVRLGDKVLHRGVFACLEVRSRRRGDADVALEDGPGFFRWDLSDGVFTRVAPTGQADPPGGPGVADPGHGPVRCDQPPPAVVLDRDHGVGARPAGPAASRGQQAGPGDQARADERAHDRVLHVAAAAGMVLPRRPGGPAAPRLPGGLAVSGVLATCRGGHRFSLRQWTAPDSAQEPRQHVPGV